MFNDFFVLFSGSVVGQLIVFASIPYFTRVYSEEVFGIFALYSSVVAILGLISTLRYELAIMLPKEDGDAVNLLAVNVLVTMVIVCLLIVLTYVYKNDLLLLLNITKIGNYIFLVPISVLLVGFINALDSWNNRLGKYKYISTGIITKSTSMVTSQFVISISSWSYLGLVPGMVIGQLINFGVSIKLTLKTIRIHVNKLSWSRIVFLAKKYKDMPRFNTLISFTNTLSNELPILLLSFFFGLNVVGIYGLAVKVSKAPPGIIGTSISKIFFKESTNIHNEGQNLFLFLKKTVKSLFLISVFLFSILLIISYYLDLIFGENWNDVGLYVRILIPWLFFGFIHSSISSVSVTLNKQKALIIVDFLFLIMRFTAIFIGYKVYNSVITSLELFSIVGVVFNISMIVYYFYITSDNNHKAYEH